MALEVSWKSAKATQLSTFGRDVRFMLMSFIRLSFSIFLFVINLSRIQIQI